MGKKLYYYVVIGLIVCLVLVVIRQFNIQDSIEEIDYDEFVAKINNDENFTVIIGRDDCPYCDKLKNYIKKLKPNIITHAYNPNTLKNQNKQITKSKNQNHPNQHNKTPSLLKIQKINRT